MHPGLKVGADPDHHIVKHKGAAGKGLQLDELLVLHLHSGCVLRGHMNVPLGDDDAAVQLGCAVGADQGGAGGGGCVAGQPHRGGDSQGTGVGHRKLHLRVLPLRAKDRNIFKFTLRANHRDPFVGQKLPGLGQVPFGGQAVAEQGLRLLLCHVDVAAGGLQLHKNTPENFLR